mmetsp:Transcript_31925/g.55561  ORF Transcript_31925/g.55561 Transcript_31925/m.55561 type:complete len:91 (-) Transcript_31925:669-941(-)
MAAVVASGPASAAVAPMVDNGPAWAASSGAATMGFIPKGATIAACCGALANNGEEVPIIIGALGANSAAEGTPNGGASCPAAIICPVAMA